jgi:enamine deaminase RidA (YjgF/YER057c/UK114 family)
LPRQEFRAAVCDIVSEKASARQGRQSAQDKEFAMKKLLPLVRVGGVLVVGMVLGWGLHAWTPDGPAAAGQDKKSPTPEERLRQLKIELPPVTKPTNTLVNAVRVGDMLYVSGTGPGKVDGKAVVGRLGHDYDVAKGKAAARLIGLQVLSVVKQELGSLDKVERLVKTLGMVHATPDFTQHPEVINGFSDLMVEVFGEDAGKGARSAVGMSSLPAGIPVEIEAIFQVRK